MTEELGERRAPRLFRDAPQEYDWSERSPKRRRARPEPLTGRILHDPSLRRKMERRSRQLSLEIQRLTLEDCLKRKRQRQEAGRARREVLHAKGVAGGKVSRPSKKRLPLPC